MSFSWKKVSCSPIFIALVALALRIFVLSVDSRRMTLQPVLQPYGFEMGQVAKSIVQGRGFSSPLYIGETGPTAWFLPIYPYLLAGIFKVWGVYTLHSLLIIKFLNCLFSALTIFPIFAAANRTFGIGIATLASWLWVGLPSAWHIPATDVWDSSLSALCFGVLFAITLALSGSRRTLAWVGYGLLWAACAMVNATIVSLTPFFFIWLVRQMRPRFGHRFRPVLAGLLFLLMGVTPWMVRNYLTFHTWIPLRSNFGLELWLGNNPEALNVNSFNMHPLWNSAEAENYKRSGEIAYMQSKLHEGISFMASHPRETLEFRAHNVFAFWCDVTDRPDSSRTRLPVRLKILFIVNLFFVFMSLIGGATVWRSHNPHAAPYVVIVSVYPLLFYLTHSLVRYRFPMESILTILSSYGVVWIVHSAFRFAPPVIEQGGDSACRENGQ